MVTRPEQAELFIVRPMCKHILHVASEPIVFIRSLTLINQCIRIDGLTLTTSFRSSVLNQAKNDTTFGTSTWTRRENGLTRVS
jgi:hypothetical protein